MNQRKPELLTIGAIADRVRGLARDPSTVNDKCRHWAKLGFLIAADGQGRGTGHHVLYRETAVYDAAVLVALTDGGLHPGEQRWLADAISVARNALADWQARVKGRTRRLFLDVLFIPPGKTMIDTREGAASDTIARLKRERPDLFTKDSFAALTITLDLGRLFETVRTGA